MTFDEVSAVEKRHVLIARPAGLPGYAPQEWCAVCGKTSVRGSTRKCIEDNCPNVCHTICLNGGETFDCFQATSLRSALNISDDVLYIDSTVDENSEDNVDQDDELSKLGNRELVAIIGRLQREITRKNSILSFFGSVTHDLASKRDAVVTVLNFIDNIVATKSSLEELEVNSVACSACPDKIDEEWSSAIEGNDQLKTWWTSEKPRKLRKVCHLEAPRSPLSTGHQQQQQPRTARSYPISNSQSVVPVQSGAVSQQPQNHGQTISHSSYGRQRSHQNIPISGNRASNNNGRGNSYFNNRSHNSLTSQQQRRSFQSNSQNTPYCTICRRRGHSDSNCEKRSKCDYCQRLGHTVHECRTRKQEERQERIYRNLIAEQTQQNQILIQSFQKCLPFNNINLPPPPPSEATPWSSHNTHQITHHQPAHQFPTQQYHLGQQQTQHQYLPINR